MRLLPYGDRAVLAEVAGTDEARALHAALLAADLPGVVDLVPAARTVLVVVAPDRLAEVSRALATLPLEDTAAMPGTLVRIPVVYDGPDLSAVASQTRLSEPEVVARHSAGHYVAAFSGFAPGFAYLTGLDPALHVPRRTTPRTSVPAGSVAVASEFTAVYPRASPGGWHLIGRTDLVLFDAHRDPAALLPPGTRVQFVEVS